VIEPSQRWRKLGRRERIRLLEFAFPADSDLIPTAARWSWARLQSFLPVTSILIARRMAGRRP